MSAFGNDFPRYSRTTTQTCNRTALATMTCVGLQQMPIGPIRILLPSSALISPRHRHVTAAQRGNLARCLFFRRFARTRLFRARRRSDADDGRVCDRSRCGTYSLFDDVEILMLLLFLLFLQRDHAVTNYAKVSNQIGC